MYQIVTDKIVQDLETGKFIPLDPSNFDYREYQTWLAKGNAPLPKDSSEEKAKRAAEINSARAAAIAQGVQYQGKTWNSDPASRENLMATLVAGAVGIPLPSPLIWRDADDVSHEVTIEFLKGLAGTMLAKAQAEYIKSWQEKDKLK